MSTFLTSQPVFILLLLDLASVPKAFLFDFWTSENCHLARCVGSFLTEP